MTSGSYDHATKAPAPSSAAVARQARKRLTGDPALCGLALLGGLVVIVLTGGTLGWDLASGATTIDSDETVLELVGRGAAVVVTGVVVALVAAAASAQSDGHDVTVRGATELLQGRWRVVLGWVAVSTVVNLSSDAVLAWLGFPTFVATIASLGWLLFTAYALPAAVLSGVAPHQALAVSMQLVGRDFRYALASNVRALFPWFLWINAAAALGAFGAIVWETYSGEVGAWAAAGAVIGVLGLAAATAAGTMQAAVSVILNTTVYRHHLGLPTPDLYNRDFPARQEG